ncbi:MAG: Asp23/Gls24 family envelope stress response protein [Clostridiales Family XIII bacterium]|jgi:uncharacterized alkaline shock family protein YloU|nr:Asp23/Gls24 family envelope stress response protein [Clostridiales Family XIII bacterium]
MSYKETTEFGTIKINDAVPGGAVRRVIADMEGRVLLSTPKGRPIRPPARAANDDYSFIETEYADGSVDVTIYIILRFGGSIQAAVQEVAAGVRAELPNVLGLKPDLVRIVVTGVQSQNLSKRNIVTETYADADAT